MPQIVILPCKHLGFVPPYEVQAEHTNTHPSAGHAGSGGFGGLFLAY